MQAVLLHRKFHFINIQEYRGLNLALRAINSCIRDTWNRANNWRIRLSLPRAVIFSAANPPDPRLDLAEYSKKPSPHRYHSPQVGGRMKSRSHEVIDIIASDVRPIERAVELEGCRVRKCARMSTVRLKRGRANIIIRALSDSKRDNSGTDLGNCCGNGWKFVRGTSLRGNLPVLNGRARARARLRGNSFTSVTLERSWDFIT
jgi:hypothetical protein